MKKLLIRLLVLAGIIFIIYNLISMLSSPQETIIAAIDQIETSFSFDGIITRDETTITARETGISELGVLDPAVSEGDMVAKGKLVAIHYDVSIDDNTKKQLADINRRLSEIKTSPDQMQAMQIDEKKIQAEIDKKFDLLFDTGKQRDARQISSIKDDINLLLVRKAAASSDSEKTMDTKESLESEKINIMRTYRGKTREILSEKHGVFTTGADGYENILTPKLATSMTVSDFNKIKKEERSSEDAVKEGVIYKISDNSKWWVSVCTDGKTAKQFKEGMSVTMRLDGENKDIKAQVEYISPALNGSYVITFSSISHSDFAFSTRFVSLTVVTQVYKGLMVPIKAIRVVDSKPGVYVKTESTVKFRNIEIIYKDKEVAIVKMNNTGNNPLLLYDEIIVSGSKK